MSKLKQLSLRILRTALACVLLLFASAFTYACLHGGYYTSKYSPSGLPNGPSERPQPLQPEEQCEPHTCGLHALSSVYRAYGLDPFESRLRFRLGVDKTAVPGTSGNEGTLHPDLFRVASQDGFRIEPLDPGLADAEPRLLGHLATQTALALVLHDGGLHWIALDGGEEGRVRVSDSLVSEAYSTRGAQFFERNVLSLVLLSPADEPRDVAGLHASGLSEMARVYDRMGVSKE